MNNIRVVQHAVTEPQQPEPQLEQQSEIKMTIEEHETSPEIPTTRLNLNSIKGYTEKRKSLKALKMKTDTVIELKKAFAIFDKTEMRLNHSLVLFCAQIVEDIFNKPKQGNLKRDIVVEVCKEHFNEDPALVEMVIDLIFSKVIKTTLWRRNNLRIKNVALLFFEIFGPSIQTNLSSRLKL